MSINEKNGYSDLAVFSPGKSTLLEGKGNSGRTCTVYETTIFDFDKRTITTQYTGGYRTMDSGPFTEIYNRNNPVCEAAFSLQSATYYSGCLNDIVDRLSHAYQDRMDLLEHTLSGGELDRESRELDEFFVKSQQAISASFSQMVGGFLDSHGQNGHTQKIYHSVQSLFAACSPRQAPGRDRPDGCYSLQELDDAAVGVSAYQSVLDTVRSTGGGLKTSARLAMADRTVEQMSLRSRESSLLDALRRTRDSVHQTVTADRQRFLDRFARQGRLNIRG